MNTTFCFQRAAGALVVILALALPLTSACPYLQCVNFTDSTKQGDCNYVVSQGFSQSEEQDILCRLWEEDYGYNNYQPPNYPPINTTIYKNYKEIDNSSFIVAFKIILLVFFSYFVYCVLTKPSFIRKWVAV